MSRFAGTPLVSDTAAPVAGERHVGHTVRDTEIAERPSGPIDPAEMTVCAAQPAGDDDARRRRRKEA
jgi:hypothetical protein